MPIGDVISDVAVDWVGMDVPATFGDSGLNSGRIILLFGRPDPLYALLLCSIYLDFAVDRKQLVTSYPADSWGQSSSTTL